LLWHDLGFAVIDSVCTVGGVMHRLNATGDGVVAWSLAGLDLLAELPTAPTPDAPTTELPHANGVHELDHVVIATPDLSRTISAFESAGLPVRRTRTAGADMTQAFFKAGPVVLEVVGSPSAHDEGPATFWGLTFTSLDLDLTAAYLGDRLRPVRPAVQRGRRIATLDRAAGSSVPLAFMSARPS
jgi:hypothetical protein